VPLAPLLSGLTLALSLGFGGLVLARWARTRKPHQLLWGIALLLFGVASGLELLGETRGWTELPYKLYFATTALMVGLMAAGTGYLLSRNLGRGFAAFALVVAEGLLILALLTPADAAAIASANAAGEVPTRVLGSIGLLHAFLDIPAALLLIVAPILGWRRTGRAYTLLISAGALVFTTVHTAASGAQTGALDLSAADVFTAGSLVGLVLLFAGYVLSREAPREASEAQPVVAALG
jgi:hypothetical protein